MFYFIQLLLVLVLSLPTTPIEQVTEPTKPRFVYLELSANQSSKKGKDIFMLHSFWFYYRSEALGWLPAHGGAIYEVDEQLVNDVETMGMAPNCLGVIVSGWLDYDARRVTHSQGRLTKATIRAKILTCDNPSYDGED